MLTLLSALALSFQVEAGAVNMAHPEDDVYVEYHLPNAQDSVRYNTIAFGGALRADTSNWMFALGYRDLGNQHVQADIIGDSDYEHGHWDSAYKARWYSTGSTRQAYFEVGPKFHLAAVDVIPSVGLGDNFFSWHYNVYWQGHGSPGAHWNIQQPNQTALAPFLGISLQYKRVSAGLYWLETAPPHTNNDFCGQGESATYARITYAFH